MIGRIIWDRVEAECQTSQLSAGYDLDDEFGVELEVGTACVDLGFSGLMKLGRGMGWGGRYYRQMWRGRLLDVLRCEYLPWFFYYEQQLSLS